jgi:hypothetical protein
VTTASSREDRDSLTRAAQDDVAELSGQIARERPDLLPLDLSYESLDRVEDFYGQQLEQGNDSTADALNSRVASYVGATLVRSAGGAWELPRAKADMNRPSVIDLPNLPRARFYPIDVVRTFRRTLSAGYMRDATEVYDIPARRLYLDRLLANRDATLDQLYADLDGLVGRGRDDDGLETVAAIEDALKKLVGEQAPPDRVRRLEDGATLYLGEIVQRAVGGDWSLCEDPDDADVGQVRISGWAPISVIRNIGPQSRTGLLQTALDLVIRARTKA